MKITFTLIGSASKAGLFTSAVDEYLGRIQHFAASQVIRFNSKEQFLTWLAKEQAAQAVATILLDGTGKGLSSEAFASHLGKLRDAGKRHLIFSIGPADGWSKEDRTQANLLVSLGAMTLPHQLAHVVLLEQVYRAFTILNGHPYHAGH